MPINIASHGNIIVPVEIFTNVPFAYSNIITPCFRLGLFIVLAPIAVLYCSCYATTAPRISLNPTAVLEEPVVLF